MDPPQVLHPPYPPPLPLPPSLTYLTSLSLPPSPLFHCVRYRVFHYLTLLITATSSLTYLILAGTPLGYTVVGDGLVYSIRYIDLAVTVPLLLLALDLLSATRLSETLFISATASLMFFTQVSHRPSPPPSNSPPHPHLRCDPRSSSALTPLHVSPVLSPVLQMFNALHPGANRWLFFTLNLLLVLPPLSALTSGYRAQAQVRLGPAVASRVGHLSLIVLLFLIIQQLFLLLTHCLHYVTEGNDVVALTLADVVVKVGYAVVVTMSGDVVEKAVDGDPMLQALCGEGEGEGIGEEGLETSIRGMRLRGGDAAHMRPEATERTGLRTKA